MDHDAQSIASALLKKKERNDGPTSCSGAHKKRKAGSKKKEMTEDEEDEKETKPEVVSDADVSHHMSRSSAYEEEQSWKYGRFTPTGKRSGVVRSHYFNDCQWYRQDSIDEDTALYLSALERVKERKSYGHAALLEDVAVDSLGHRIDLVQRCGAVARGSSSGIDNFASNTLSYFTFTREEYTAIRTPTAAASKAGFYPFNYEKSVLLFQLYERYGNLTVVQDRWKYYSTGDVNHGSSSGVMDNAVSSSVAASAPSVPELKFEFLRVYHGIIALRQQLFESITAEKSEKRPRDEDDSTGAAAATTTATMEESGAVLSPATKAARTEASASGNSNASSSVLSLFSTLQTIGKGNTVNNAVNASSPSSTPTSTADMKPSQILEAITTFQPYDMSQEADAPTTSGHNMLVLAEEMRRRELINRILEGTQKLKVEYNKKCCFYCKGMQDFSGLLNRARRIFLGHPQDNHNTKAGAEGDGGDDGREHDRSLFEISNIEELLSALKDLDPVLLKKTVSTVLANNKDDGGSLFKAKNSKSTADPRSGRKQETLQEVMEEVTENIPFLLRRLQLLVNAGLLPFTTEEYDINEEKLCRFGEEVGGGSGSDDDNDKDKEDGGRVRTRKKTATASVPTTKRKTAVAACNICVSHLSECVLMSLPAFLPKILREAEEEIEKHLFFESHNSLLDVFHLGEGSSSNSSSSSNKDESRRVGGFPENGEALLREIRELYSGNLVLRRYGLRVGNLGEESEKLKSALQGDVRRQQQQQQQQP